jgi:HlyD family secretion protein
MSDNPLFRKAALDKLSSPERLDVLMQVTSPQGWVALLAIGVILVLTIVWSIFYSIPERIDGQGIIIRGGTLREVRASGDGVLTQMAIKLNDEVATDQVIGQIQQQGIEDKVRGADLKYQEAQREAQTAAAEDQATIAQHNATISGYQGQIASIQAQLGSVEADLTAKKELLAKGLITTARVQAIEQQALSLRGQMSSLRGTIGSLNATIASIQQKIRARGSQVELARAEKDRAAHSATDTTQIKSTVTGRVIEMKKNVGDRVQYGEVIATIEPPSASLEPIIYVSSTIGKRIKPGMEAQISPSTIKREEFGFMKGEVLAVGEYPVSPEAVMSVVANKTLAQELIGNATKLEVRVKLRASESTPSGYEWSSSAGPPFKIDSGTRLLVSFVVDRKPPIAYVLPIIKSTLGVS